MTATVTVLGSSAMFATGDRACSGYLVDVGDRRLLLDCGAGVWRNLIRYCDYVSVDGVILSHRHPDHVSDLFQLFHARRYGWPEPLPKISLWAPAETLEMVSAVATDLDQAFYLSPLSPGDSIQLGGADFSFFEMAHPPDTLGVRIETGEAVFAYSADTGPGGDIDGLAAGADIFICEATLQDSDETWEGHMSASQAGEAAARVGVSKIVLTHLPPARDAGLSLAEATRTSNGVRVQLAADGLRLEITE